MPEILAFNLRRLRRKKAMAQEQLALALDELPGELLRLPRRGR